MVLWCREKFVRADLDVAQQGNQPIAGQGIGSVRDARRAIGNHRMIVGVQRRAAGKAREGARVRR